MIADKVATNAITSLKIAANAVTAEKIEALAVSADKIAANAITAPKIAAGAITASKLQIGDRAFNIESIQFEPQLISGSWELTWTAGRLQYVDDDGVGQAKPVSYKHLTLPTICSV